MRCRECEAENAGDASFCESCGAALACNCPACGASAAPGARFCRKCGTPLAGDARAAAPRASYTPPHLATKILTSRSALEGERKQVTVLFADVKGSMELAEQVDAEEWHRIMERFFETLTEGVHRFEGTINQYTGDGIMALFGAPIAHEDHAQRACHAALYLRDALRAYADELRSSSGLNFSVRMGMNSGEVVVGKIGDDLRMDYTAQGLVVGLAARMEQLAEPGTVLLTAHTARLVSGYFALRDLGASRIKGVSEPVNVFVLEGPGVLHTRFDLSRTRGFSRFVGRAQEMAELEEALGRSSEGQGQVLGVVAEAGAGKSRLCHEFTQQCRERGLEVVGASAVPHGRLVPFLPVLQMLRALCGVNERESGAAARAKIAGALLWRDEAFREDLPLLFDFLGVPDPDHPGPRAEPEVLQRRLFRVLQRLIRTSPQSAPMVLLFEDLHWIDGASAAALENLIDAVPETRTLLLLNFRPEYQAAWMKRPHYRQLPLRPLAAEATTALLADLLGRDEPLAELAERIRERAGGNPFFVEEIVQSLVETGALVGTRGAYRQAGAINETMLPVTVQAGLAARIDRLSEGEKQVLQAAAVIGKEFAEPVLERVAERSPFEVEAALRALVAGEFLYQTAVQPEAEYEFKHPLTHEVAYRSQLGERRAQVHAGVARAIENLYPDRLDEHAALLAQHWESAGDAETAAEWHRRAAVWVGAHDRSEMLRHWRQVRALLDTVPPTAETLRTRILARIQILHNGLFLGQVGGDTEALFREGDALVTQVDDPMLHVWLLGEQAMVQQQVGALDDALLRAKEGVRLADVTGEVIMQLMIRVSLLWVLLQSGRLREAVATSDEAERLSRGDPQAGAAVLGFSPLGSVLTLRAAALSLLGRLPEAFAAIRRAVEIGEQRRDAEVLTWASTWGVQVCWIAGDAEQALYHGRRGVEFSEIAGSTGLRADACVSLARAHLLEHQYAAALEALARARKIVGRRDGEEYGEPLYLSVLARAHLGSGDVARARTAADHGVALVRDKPGLAVAAQLARIKVLLAVDGAAARAPVESHLRDIAQLIERMDARGLLPFLLEERAALARARGDDAAWARELREAKRLFDAIGASAYAARIEHELGGEPATRAL